MTTVPAEAARRVPDVPAARVVDPAVVAELPPGTTVRGLAPHGSSFWTRTARLDAERDGVGVAYFLKTATGALGCAMMESEFRCTRRLRRAAGATDPAGVALVPEPIAWGTYVGSSGGTGSSSRSEEEGKGEHRNRSQARGQEDETHFLLCEFRPLTGEVPAAAPFAARIAALHRAGAAKGSSGGEREGVGESRRGRFGSDIPTFHGNVHVDHGWSDSWEEYFARTTRVLLEMERAARGSDDEIERLAPLFFAKVVPRLLRPLETCGHVLRPTLVHGDLWDGNAGVDARTGAPVVFDAASFYAHNEYDLGVWRQPWNKLNAPYRAEYLKHFPASPPEADFDDRNLLYATQEACWFTRVLSYVMPGLFVSYALPVPRIRYVQAGIQQLTHCSRVNILDSILYKDDPSYRTMLIAGMRALVDKFPSGFDAWETERDRGTRPDPAEGILQGGLR
ncbi:Fructosamine kinase-domain-containing protein [Durotheca rogersii]|uniref:Fructosamine kinase-domain-containing protein n=1 Tax=Durotheca rogersii TaxID=419775 RepID=UPI00221F67CE|nr:Fructosamine kinase-domain-containing protein [Durotheca rogersii]KAI5860486.1 Fructosamine kinase-domain-containing protein [Durotheca rogersii]